ncbi:hypothetical protein [Azospirillum sp. SYSU D00513]|uniref:hypothetical protein n=1 Tax=Azospirillum sp. SYSU D00513 TaxID=2812561 RepID=UPI001A967B1C|nr:hypothetical protein [Azospirillum sp. SYSU D00513]
MTLNKSKAIDRKAVAAAREALAIWKAWEAEMDVAYAGEALVGHILRVLKGALAAEQSMAGTSDFQKELLRIVTKSSTAVDPLPEDVQSPEDMKLAKAWLATHDMTLKSVEDRWKTPFENAGYVIMEPDFVVDFEGLASVDDPSDELIWRVIESAVLSRREYWKHRASVLPTADGDA